MVDSALECCSEVRGMLLFEERIVKMAAGCMFCSSNPTALASHTISEGNDREIVYNTSHLRQWETPI